MPKPTRYTLAELREYAETKAFLAKLETKGFAAMAFPAFGGGMGGNGSAYWGDGTSTWFGNLLPGATYDWEAQAGPLWLNSVVSICLNWIADNFAEPELIVERRAAGSGELKPIRDHDFLDLMHDPNPDYGADELWYGTLISYLTAADAYWLKARSPSGKKLALYWCPHWEIEPRWTTDGKSYITHYEHIVDGKRIPLQKKDVVHFRHGLNPFNIRQGLPQLTPVLREICSDNQANSYVAAILKNMGVPGVLIMPESDTATIEEPEQKAIGDLWVERTAGDNVGRPLVNNIKLKVQELTLSPEKMALDKIRRIPEARICAALKIPPTVVNLSSGEGQRSYANAMTDVAKAYRDCLIPLQKSMARTLTRQLLPDVGGRDRECVRWDYSRVESLQEEQDSLTKRTVVAFTGGIISREEGRSKLGYGPAKPGDTFVTPKGGSEGAAGDEEGSEDGFGEPSALPKPKPAKKSLPGPDTPTPVDPFSLPLRDRLEGKRAGGVAPTAYDEALPFVLMSLASLGLVEKFRDGKLTAEERDAALEDVVAHAGERLREPASAILDGTRKDDQFDVAGALAILTASRTNIDRATPDERRAKLGAIVMGASKYLKDEAKGAMDEAGDDLPTSTALLSSWSDDSTTFIGSLILAGGLTILGRAFDAAASASARAAYRGQLDYWSGFESDVKTGEQPLDGTLPNRAAQYGQCGWQIAINLGLEAATGRAVKLGKRVLGTVASAHCQTCVAEEAKGWMPVEDLRPLGDSECGALCHCYFIFA